jgi:hypothetical protein
LYALSWESNGSALPIRNLAASLAERPVTDQSVLKPSYGGIHSLGDVAPFYLKERYMQSIEQILKSLHADAVELQKIKAESLTISTFNLGEARYRLDLAETLITLISESGLDTRLLQRAKNLVDLNIASLDVNEQARYGNAPEKSSLATVESQKKIYYHRKALYEARENLDGSVNVWPQGGGVRKELFS